MSFNFMAAFTVCSDFGFQENKCVLGGSEIKASARNAGDLGSIPGLGRSPGEGNGNPLLPGESHGQGSLACCNPQDRKEPDTTE